MIKKYRVIEPFGIYSREQMCIPTESEDSVGMKCWDMLEHNTEIHFDRRNFFNDFEVGDIVNFEQLEKWIDEGLQPIYFTEEVIENKIIQKLFPDDGVQYINLERTYDAFDFNYGISDNYKSKNDELKEENLNLRLFTDLVVSSVEERDSSQPENYSLIVTSNQKQMTVTGNKKDMEELSKRLKGGWR